MSLLSDVSKIFGKFVYQQINDYVEPRFSHLLCGFQKKKHNTHEKWKLLLAKECNMKLSAYGLSENAIAYIKS